MEAHVISKEIKKKSHARTSAFLSGALTRASQSTSKTAQEQALGQSEIVRRPKEGKRDLERNKSLASLRPVGRPSHAEASRYPQLRAKPMCARQGSRDR